MSNKRPEISLPGMVLQCSCNVIIRVDLSSAAKVSVGVMWGASFGLLGYLCFCSFVNLLHFWFQSPGKSLYCIHTTFFPLTVIVKFLQLPVSQPLLLMKQALSFGMYQDVCISSFASRTMRWWKHLCMEIKLTPQVLLKVPHNNIVGVFQDPNYLSWKLVKLSFQY